MNWRSRSISLDRPTLFLMKNANNNIPPTIRPRFWGKTTTTTTTTTCLYIIWNDK
jgi:hypothetical protein